MRRRFERVERNLEKKEVEKKSFFDDLKASITFNDASAFWNALFAEEINKSIDNK